MNYRMFGSGISAKHNSVGNVWSLAEAFSPKLCFALYPSEFAPLALIAVFSLLAPTSVRAEQMHSPPSSHTQHSTPHSHEKLEIPAGKLVPAVDLEIAPDPMGGWNVQVKAENFRFAPEQVNQTSTVNEGHAHLYVDGKKRTRLYGAWYYLDNLPTGPHSVTVTLNTNRHEELFHNGKRIEVTKRFIVFPAAAGH